MFLKMVYDKSISNLMLLFQILINKLRVIIQHIKGVSKAKAMTNLGCYLLFLVRHCKFYSLGYFSS